MNKQLRKVFFAACLSMLALTSHEQSVLLDAHSDGSNTSTWQITTTHPGELIIISADGYGGGPYDHTPGNVTVNSANATFITQGSFYDGGEVWVSSIWAFEAPTVGTYTLTSTENGLSSPWYFNYASAVYSPSLTLHLGNILIGGNDSNQALDTIRASITTTENNSWVYGTTCWNDNGGSGTLNWQGGLTELDHDYISNGVDCAQADSTYAAAGLKNITLTNTGASNTWATIALIAVQPPVCNLSITIDSLVSPSCHDSIWAVVTGGSGHYSYSWSPGGSTRDTIGHVCPGTYTITVTDDSTGCSKKDSVSLSALGIINLTKTNSEVQVYPNPFTQNFSVDITINQPVMLSLFNMLGENVGSWTVTNGHHSVDAQQYPAGVYMLQAKTMDGRVILNRKMVKLSQ